MLEARRLLFAALATVACENASSPGGAADAGAEAAPALVDGGAEVPLGCLPSDPQPCPPAGYPTWPMPSPPGVPSPHTASYLVQGEVVRDRITGLDWHRSFTAKVSWSAALDHCDALVAGGFDDWRLPSRIELVSLVDYSRLPSIDEKAFPDTADDYYWSSSRRASDDQLAYSVYFGAGLTAYGSISGPSGHARCVRGGSPGVRPRFRVGESEALDENTGLVWQRRVPDQKLAWDTAMEFCQQLGWRLPSTKELQTIVDETRLPPTIDGEVFPDTPADLFWTSTPVNRAGVANAVYVDLRDGATEEAGVVEPHWVRCVR